MTAKYICDGCGGPIKIGEKFARIDFLDPSKRGVIHLDFHADTENIDCLGDDVTLPKMYYNNGQMTITPQVMIKDYGKY